MMHWIGIILAIYIVQLNAFLAAEICPASQYLSSSGVCVDCTPCYGSKNVTLRPCTSNVDSVCGTVADIQTHIPDFAKPNKSKKAKSESVKLNTPKNSSTKAVSKNPVIVKQANDDSDDYDYSYEYEPSTAKPVKKTTNKTAKAKKNKIKNKNELSILLNEDIDLASAKLKANKNGKHIKKDLSQEGGASVEYAVKSKVGEVTKNSVTSKAKSKSKTNSVKVNDHPMTIGNTQFVVNGEEFVFSHENEPEVSVKNSQWPHLIYPHVENHQIYLDMENDNVSKSETGEKSAKVPMTKSGKKKSSTQMQVSVEEIAKILGNGTHLPGVSRVNYTDILDMTDDDYDELVKKNLAAVHGAVGKDNSDIIADDDDDDEDDEDEEDDDDDDEDDEDDEDEDEDDDDDTDEDDDYSLSGSKMTGKYPQFGDSPPRNEEIEDEDYDMGVDNARKNIVYAPPENDVNMEPFSSSSNWQLLILVSAASACLLFFIVVNAYICIYMKKWKHMKQDFEADVEDLSVRINLMQHAGFEAEETSNMKNYITQLRGGKSSNDKLPKTNNLKP